jgi:F0F1-type ATP synthase assembly protein I
LTAGPSTGWRLAGELTDCGLRFALVMLLAAWGGWTLDQRWSTLPWLTLASSLAGFGVGLYWLLLRVRDLGRKEE